MKNWHSRLLTSVGAGALTLFALVVFAYASGNQISAFDMVVAGGLGAAIGWVATLL